MAIDPSIALGVRPVAPVDFNEIGARVATIRNAMAQQQHQQTADDLAQRQYQDRVDQQTQDRHRRQAQDAWLGALQVDPRERQAFLLQRTQEMGLDPVDEQRAIATLSAVPADQWDDAHVAARAQSLGGNPNAGLRTLANTDVLVNANHFGTPVTATGAGQPYVNGNFVVTPHLPTPGTQMGVPGSARPTPTAPTPEPFTFAPPVAGGRISSPFGPRTAPMAGASSNHLGVDYAVPIGTPVTASAPGVVIPSVAGDRLGTSVRVRHPDGSVSIYGHLSTANVRPGDQVEQGQPLGLSGRSGTSTGPNLHYEVLGPDGRPVNPETLLGRTTAPAQATPAAPALPPGVTLTPEAQAAQQRQANADARAARADARAQADFNDRHGPATSVGTPGLTGADYLASLPAAMRPTVQAIAEGRMGLQQLPRGASRQQYIDAVTQFDPTFNAGDFQSRVRARTAYTSGTPAQNIVALNTGIGHLLSLDATIDDLGNVAVPLVGGSLNRMRQTARAESGDPTITRFRTLRNAVASESTRIFRGATGASADVQRAIRDIDESQSPAQLHAAVRALADLWASRAEALTAGYQTAMGPGARPPGLDPRASTALEALRTGQRPPRGGQAARPAAGPPTGMEHLSDEELRRIAAGGR